MVFVLLGLVFDPLWCYFELRIAQMT
jgi:hypothetical protein